MDKEEDILFKKIEAKRLEIADCLFSPQRHVNRVNNAKKLVRLSGELADLCFLLEKNF